MNFFIHGIEANIGAARGDASSLAPKPNIATDSISHV
jgi:hypothetical protein